MLGLSACAAPLAVDAQPVVPTATSTLMPSPPATSTAIPSVTSTPTLTAEPTVTLIPTATPAREISLLFTGIIVPGRCVQAAVDRYGNADFLYDGVRELIQVADLAIGTLNGTITDNSPLTGCVRTFVLVGDSRHVTALANAGFDGMSVATNHIKNCNFAACGDLAFLDTLDNLRQAGILPIGAGNTLAEGMQPVIFEVNGVRIGIVSLGEIEQMAFAGENSPGIAVLNEDNLRASLASARQQADFVIAMPHWGPEYSPIPNWNQRTFAQIAVEAGADLVVGNHTHVIQAVQTIDGVPVFYGLGNFVFDQDWSRETQQSVLLRVTLRDGEVSGWELIPVVATGEGAVSLADPQEAAQILERIEQVSAGLR